MKNFEWLTPALLLALIGMVYKWGGELLTLYTNIQIKFRELEIRVSNAEDQDKTVLRKLEEIARDVNQIRVDLQDKEDRE